MTIIELDHVKLYYDQGKPNEYYAIRDISLKIEAGQYAAFFGVSGSGKTSLLYAISGMEKIQGGRVLVAGKDIATMTRKEQSIYRQVTVGIVFQQFNLIPSITVLDNIALPMAFLGIPLSERQERAGALLKRFGISELGNRFPFELSGGQQQRVGIARALANDPPIVIADEPLGNLDSENANKALDFLRELNQKDGRTIIMVTHEAWSLKDATIIYYVKDGQIVKTENRSGQSGPFVPPISANLREELERSFKKAFANIEKFNDEHHVHKEINKSKVLALFQEKLHISNNDIEHTLGVSDATATRYLEELVGEAKLMQHGKIGKAVYYTIQPHPADPKAKTESAPAKI